MKAWLQFGAPVALVACAAVMVLDPLPPYLPIAAPTVVPGWATNTAPVRHPTFRPTYQVAGYTYQCMDCHRIIPSPAETFRRLTQHTEIEFNHGINTRCFNCHHLGNRNAFVDDFGDEIPWDQPQRLCAKCHGPVYRDWQAGSHGRSNGYWDTTRGPQTRLRCIECHDPHTPPFAAMAPAPGPTTLRMGLQEAPSHVGKRDPLRVYSQEQPAHP